MVNAEEARKAVVAWSPDCGETRRPKGTSFPCRMAGWVAGRANERGSGRAAHALEEIATALSAQSGLKQRAYRGVR